MEQKEDQPIWAIVELFGHQQIAGRLSNYVIGGQSFVRVDVPLVPAVEDAGGPIAAHTKLYGAGAIYAINFVDEQIATYAASRIRHKPINTYEARDFLRSLGEGAQRLLASPEA